MSLSLIVNLHLHYPHLLEFKLTLQNSTMFCTSWLIYLKHIYLIFPQRYHDSSNSILIADRQILILLIYLRFYLLYVFCLISNYKSKSSCSTQNEDNIYMYIQTWVKRSLLGQRKCGLIIHVTFQKRFNSYESFYDRANKMWPFNTGDCLIEVIAWEDLTVHIRILLQISSYEQYKYS